MTSASAKAEDAPRVAMQVTRGIVIATVQIDLTEPVLARFQDELLALIHRVGAHGVVFDLSGLDLMDSVEFAGLCQILKAAKLLGARGVLSGLGPGIVSSLIDADVDIGGIDATNQVDDAVTLIRADVTQRDASEEGVDDAPLQDGLAEHAAEPRPAHEADGVAFAYASEEFTAYGD